MSSDFSPEAKEIMAFADEVGANTVYDTLNSDIKYYYPSGCKNLDIVLGGGGNHTGGIPSGRFVELFGYESTGKSTIALCICKSFVDYWKSKGEKSAVLWIEAESVFDKPRAMYIGCDLKRFLLKEENTLEGAFATIHDFIDRGESRGLHTMVVCDTVAALHPAAELEKGEFAGGMMAKPRILKNLLSKIMPKLGKTNTPMIFVNQLYAGGAPYQPSQSPGGGGLKFYASIRAEVSVSNKITKMLPSGDEMGVAIETKLFTRKNKVTLPNQICYLYIDGEKGLQPLETAILFCEKAKLVSAKGSWKTLIIKKKKEDGTLEDVELKYQNKEQLKKAAKNADIDLLEYLDYLTTKYYSEVSIFLKANLIDDLWAYEEKLFGKRETVLTDEEREVSQMIYQREVIDNPENL